MTTFAGRAHASLIRNKEDLNHYFEAFAKTRECMRVGLEAEFFAIDKGSGKALPYKGKRGIEAILKYAAGQFHYEPLYEDRHVIALRRKDTLISLEPGGQVELSAPPVFNVFEIEDQLNIFLSEMRAVRNHFAGIEWLASGIHPFSTAGEIAWVPKARYKIMAEYFRTHGTMSHEMMKCTASNQINFDYLSESHAMANLRVVLGITSIVTALFANSAFSGGGPNGFMSRRLQIWNHTDPDRTGLLSGFIREGAKFRDYVDYLLKMPLIFIVRGEKWVPVMGTIDFARFIRDGFKGAKATVGDFELHLSTAFPEARLKQYLEVRGVDGQSMDLIPAAAAFWKGILYDAETREKAWNLVAFASPADRLKLHREAPAQGLRATLGGRPIYPMAEELVNLSCASLAKQKTADASRDECLFLQRIREKIIYPKRSPAEATLEKWSIDFRRDPARLIEYLSIG